MCRTTFEDTRNVVKKLKVSFCVRVCTARYVVSQATFYSLNPTRQIRSPNTETLVQNVEIECHDPFIMDHYGQMKKDTE